MQQHEPLLILVSSLVSSALINIGAFSLIVPRSIISHPFSSIPLVRTSNHVWITCNRFLSALCEIALFIGYTVWSWQLPQIDGNQKGSPRRRKNSNPEPTRLTRGEDALKRPITVVPQLPTLCNRQLTTDATTAVGEQSCSDHGRRVSGSKCRVGLAGCLPFVLVLGLILRLWMPPSFSALPSPASDFASAYILCFSLSALNKPGEVSNESTCFI